MTIFNSVRISDRPVRISEHLSVFTNKPLTCDRFSWYNRVDRKKGAEFMKKLRFLCFSLIAIFLLFFSLFSNRVPVRALDGYLEGGGFLTYRYELEELDGTIVIDLTYPAIIVEGYEIPIEIDLISFPSGVGPVTLQGINFDVQEFTVYVTEFYNDTVDFYVDPSYPKDKIWLTVIKYTYKGTLKTKHMTTAMPVTVITPTEYYAYEIEKLNGVIISKNSQIASLNQQIQELQDEIQELQDALSTEFDRGYDEGFDEGYDEGYDVGYNEGIIVTEVEAYEQGFIDGQKSKLAENNAAFYQGIEKWLVPAIITVIALGGFVTIAARKRRDE